MDDLEKFVNNSISKLEIRQAIKTVMRKIDDCYLAGDFESPRKCIDKLDLEQLHPAVITSITVVAWWAADKDPAWYEKFYKKAYRVFVKKAGRKEAKDTLKGLAPKREN